MRLKSLTIFILSFVCAIHGIAKADDYLLVSHYIHHAESDCTKGTLTAYIFDKEGNYIKEKNLTQFNIDYTPPPFGLYSQHIILKNRYLTSDQYIFDLENEEFIHNGYLYPHISYVQENTTYYVGDFLGIYGNKVLYSGHDPKAYFPVTYVFNLDTKEYGASLDPRYYFVKNGVYSPDGQKVAISSQKLLKTIFNHDNDNSFWDIEVVNIENQTT